MKPKPEPGICSYGTLIILKHTREIAREIEGVSKANDIEAIHRMRVASRRLRSALPLFSNCLPARRKSTWEKQIKNITASLGAARDTDVQIERLSLIFKKLEDKRLRPGINRLLVRLKQRRTKMQSEVQAALNSLVKSNTLGNMDIQLSKKNDQTEPAFAFSRALYELANGAITQRLNELLSYDEIVYQPEKVAELHQMRIAAKWLRYTLEIFARIYSDRLRSAVQAGRKIQESLGTIHDDDVWLQYLPELGEQERKKTLNYYGNIRPINRLIPGFEYFQEICQEERNRTYRGFVRDWQRWKDRGLWDKLRHTIALPLAISENIYPPAPPIEELS